MIPPQDYEFLRAAGVQGIYGPGSNIVECAADMLRLLGHNMPPVGERARSRRVNSAPGPTYFAALSLLMLVSGVGIPVMAALNAGLGRHLESPTAATAVLFGVGFLAALTVAVLVGLPAPASFRNAPAQLGLGAIFVVFYVLAITVTAPRIGVANAVFFVLLGQMHRRGDHRSFCLDGCHPHSLHLAARLWPGADVRRPVFRAASAVSLPPRRALGFTVEELVPAGRGSGALRMGLARLGEDEWLWRDFDRAARVGVFGDHPDSLMQRPGAGAAAREAARLVAGCDELGEAATCVWKICACWRPMLRGNIG